MLKHTSIRHAIGALAALPAMASGCGEVPVPAPLPRVTAPFTKLFAKLGSTEPAGTMLTISTNPPVTHRTRSLNGLGGTASQFMTSRLGGSPCSMGQGLEISKYAFNEQQKEFYIVGVSSS